ncbi:MAG: ABC transporter ATP-binding protein [Deltaproteobacteria bacterium]|nr:MAG: ABC transporter ATP-binding protein [Deltaproteobacteria bacterium]
MLRTEDLHSGYGEVTILRGVSIEAREGKITAIIGSNGAGKTTLMNTITGVVPTKKGKILFKGEDISRIPAHERVRLGISLVPEGRKIFGRLTVERNLIMGAYTLTSEEKFRENLEFVYSLFPRLRERRKQLARSLSGGEMQMLAIGRALMSGPDLLLLDEPSLGIAPVIVKQIFRVLRELNEREGKTILLVEQNVKEALSLASYVYVLKNGAIVLEGPSEEVSASDEVKKSYLGM